MGNKNVESNAESSEKPEYIESAEVEKPSEEHESPEHPSTSEEHEGAQTDISSYAATEKTAAEVESKLVTTEKTNDHSELEDGKNAVLSSTEKHETVSPLVPTEPTAEPAVKDLETSDSVENLEKKEMSGVGSLSSLDSEQENSGATEVDQAEGNAFVPDESDNLTNVHDSTHKQKAEVEIQSTDENESLVGGIDEQKRQVEESVEIIAPVQTRELRDTGTGITTEPSIVVGSSVTEESDSAEKSSISDLSSAPPSNEVSETVPEFVSNENNTIIKAVGVDEPVDVKQNDSREQHSISGSNASDSTESAFELERLKMEMKMMESALQGAARQAQVCDKMILDNLIYVSFLICCILSFIAFLQF